MFYRHVPRGGEQLDMRGLVSFLQEFMPDLNKSELNFFKASGHVCVAARAWHSVLTHIGIQNIWAVKAHPGVNDGCMYGVQEPTVSTLSLD